MTEWEQYNELSKFEKLTTILTTCLNDTLRRVSFGTYTRVILVVQNEKDIDFYLCKNGYEVGCFSRDLDPTITYEQDDILYAINTLCAETDDPECEEDRRIPMGRAMSIGQLDGKNIYVLPTACNEGFPKGLLWQKIYEFFIHGWSEIIDQIDEHPIFDEDYSGPDDVLRNLYFEWDWVTVACCRALHEGGFNTGYGDPYESQILFSIIDAMSSLNYEKRESKGTLVSIPDEASESFPLTIKLIDTIPIDEKLIKTYRKLLEMSSEEIALAFGVMQVLGLTECFDFEWKVVFHGNKKWKYYYKDQVIFTVDNGDVIIGKEASQVNERIFSDEEGAVKNSEIVEAIVRGAMKQNHGTSVLFTDKAEAESDRLSKYRRCIQIESVNLSEHPEMILPLTSIDGALMVDFNGNCYGVGAILDGEAVCAGDFGRGARYNSAVNYIGWKKETDNEHEYCAVVISEDGVHDIIDTNTIDKIMQDLDDPYGNG